jgi:hypothetical protein
VHVHGIPRMGRIYLIWYKWRRGCW